MSKLEAKPILDAIDAYCAHIYDDGPRNHLGASEIGDECPRKLWYKFRWHKHVKHSGRQQRLFNRGHREEERFLEWLVGIGFVIEPPPEGQNQHRISGVMGHFGGSMDGVATYQGHRILLEFKTSGTGAKFNDLDKLKVARAKPMHWQQMCTYGYAGQLEQCLYLCINKNDDGLYGEIVDLDWQAGQRNFDKAEAIITANTPPNRISSTPAFFNCKYCDFVNICHAQEKPEKNCRSCVNAIAVDNAEWKCQKYNNVIPSDFIAKGCDSWERIEGD